jgi:hypothetical protein
LKAPTFVTCITGPPPVGTFQISRAALSSDMKYTHRASCDHVGQASLEEPDVRRRTRPLEASTT